MKAGHNHSLTKHSDTYHSSSFVSVPSDVVGVSVVNRNDTAMNLQWNIVTNTDNNTYNYTLKNVLTEEMLPIYTDDHSLVTREISGLIPATNYRFILYTIFDDVRSKGYNFTNYTSTSISLQSLLVSKPFRLKKHTL